MLLGKDVGLGPGHIVLDGDPVPPQQPLSTFRPMSNVAKRLPISATAELLWFLLSILFFLVYSQPLQIGCLPYGVALVRI